MGVIPRDFLTQDTGTEMSLKWHGTLDSKNALKILNKMVEARKENIMSLSIYIL